MVELVVAIANAAEVVGSSCCKSWVEEKYCSSFAVVGFVKGYKGWAVVTGCRSSAVTAPVSASASVTESWSVTE